MGKNKMCGLGNPKQNLDQNVTIWETIFWETHYFNLLYNLALCRYKWLNLPPTVDERYLEMMLLLNGHCVFFKNDILGFLALGSSDSGDINIYGIPTLRHAVAENGENFEIDETDSVIIWNNRLHIGEVTDLLLYSQRIAMCTQIENININVQSTPAIILCEEKEKQSLLNLFSQYSGKMPIIKGYKGLNLDAFKVLNLEAPFVADKINVQKHKILNEAYTFLGINNANQEKREREVSAEAQGNYESVLMGREVGLMERKTACEKINRMFGLNIDVVFNPTLNKLYEKLIEDEVDLGKVGDEDV